MRQQNYLLWGALTLISSLLGLVLGGLYACWTIAGSIPDLVTVAFRWQELIGSLVGALMGALTAMLIFAITVWHKAYGERKEHTMLLLRSISMALNNLMDIDRILHNFSTDSLGKLITSIPTAEDTKETYVGQAFMPRLHVFEFSGEFVKKSTGSGYIDIQIMELINMSRGIAKSIEDMQRQFESTIASNTQLGLAKANKPSYHNTSFVQNLKNFDEQLLKSQTFKLNIPAYAKKLIKAEVTIASYIEWGRTRWKRTFRHLERGPQQDIQSAVDEYFANEIQGTIEEFKAHFKSPL